MNIQLQQFARPWQGNELFAQAVDTYHFHDIPLIGLIEQFERLYLFRCIGGEAEGVNFWTYVHVTADQRAAIEATANPEDFDALVGELTEPMGVVAVAADGHGIIAWLERAEWPDAQKAADQLTSAVGKFFDQRVADADHDAAELEAEAVVAKAEVVAQSDRILASR